MKKTILLIIPIMVFLSCNQNQKEKGITTMNQLNSKQLEIIKNKKIYFGHMSVGYNIISGVQKFDVLNVIESEDVSNIKNGFFAHSKIGKNCDPYSKIDDFSKKMKNGIGDNVDIAFFKFCYVDIKKSSDVKSIFLHYKKSLDSLSKIYPKVKFIHFTVPLTAEESIGLKQLLKDTIKSLLGRIPEKKKSIYDNIKRQEYNNLIKKEYKSEHIFDLATYESSQKGKTITSEEGNVKHQLLLADYTNDGGHLNGKGSIYLATQLLKFLHAF